MVLSPFWKAQIKGRLSGLPFRLLWLSSEYPVPSLQKMTVLSFSEPEMRGSSASKVPSSLSKPAFSYFQGVPVSKSTSFPEVFLLEQPVARVAAVNVNIIHLQNIRVTFSVRRIWTSQV